MRNKDKNPKHSYERKKDLISKDIRKSPISGIVYKTQLTKLVQQFHLVLKMLSLVYLLKN